MISFAIIGFVDDYLKVAKKNAKGFRGSVKLVIQFIIVSLVMFFLQMTNSIYFDGVVEVPFLNINFDLGLFYIFFATFVIVGAANAVNLTDGLDGLVSVPAIITLSSTISKLIVSINFLFLYLIISVKFSHLIFLHSNNYN